MAIETEKMPGWAVGIIAVIITAIAAGASVIGYKLIKKATTHNESNDVVNDAGKSVTTSNLSFPQSTYSTLASVLFTAMDGIGTDTSKVFSTIQTLKTTDDWLALVGAFGTKKATGWATSYSGNLVEWLSDELSTSEYSKLEGILKLIHVTI